MVCKHTIIINTRIWVPPSTYGGSGQVLEVGRSSPRRRSPAPQHQLRKRSIPGIAHSAHHGSQILHSKRKGTSCKRIVSVMLRVSGVRSVLVCACVRQAKTAGGSEKAHQANPPTHMLVKYASWCWRERSVLLSPISLYPAHPNNRRCLFAAVTCHKLLRDSPPVLGMWKNTTVWQPSGSHGAGSRPASPTPATPAPFWPSREAKAEGLALASFRTEVNDKMTHPAARKRAE